MTEPAPWTDGPFCPTCRVHRSDPNLPGRQCPGCRADSDEAKRQREGRK